jgi:hypothetical protein
MASAIIAVVILVVLPLWYLGRRLGLDRSPLLRIIGPLFLLSLVALEAPWGGLDIDSLDRMKLFLAGWTLLLTASKGRGELGGTTYFRLLVGTSVAAVTIYFNFFSFHAGQFLHYHDIAHYYLGSKYFRELGYGELYTAMIRAEAEVNHGRFASPNARDLSTNRVVPVESLLAESDRVKARFSPNRWSEFSKDSAFFRDEIGSGYQMFLTDHGFNPTPVWAWIGGFIANRVTVAGAVGVAGLALIDPMLLIAAFLGVAWAFDLETALLAVIHFTVIFGASFDWLGGGFLRYLWFAVVIIGACCVQKERHGLGGGLFALASLLRIFPALFVTGLALKTAADLVDNRRISDCHRRFWVSFAVVSCVLLFSTLVWAGGVASWIGFHRNLAIHMESWSSNVVGLTNAIALWSSLLTGEGRSGAELFAWRAATYQVQVATVLPLALILVAMLVRRVGDLPAIALGLFLIIAGLNLTAYYYSMLVLLLLVRAREPEKIAVIFGTGCATFTLRLFEDHLFMVFIYRGVLVLYLIVAMFLDEIIAEGRRWSHRPTACTRAAR